MLQCKEPRVLFELRALTVTSYLIVEIASCKHKFCRRKHAILNEVALNCLSNRFTEFFVAIFKCKMIVMFVVRVCRSKCR